MPIGNTIKCRGFADSVSGETPDYDYYVDPVRGLDTNNGLSPITAFESLEAAVSAVGSAGGKKIGLMSGNHGANTLTLTFDAEVVIESIISRGARLTRSFFNDVERCTFNGIKFRSTEGNVQPNPNNAPDVVEITNPFSVVFDDCEFSCDRQLRTFYALVTSGASKAEQVTVKNCLIEDTGAGIRWLSGATDCTVEDTLIQRTVGSPLGNQGRLSTGLIYRRNEIRNVRKMPEDPEWTSGGTTGTWGAAHASLIATRDAVGVTIEDNLVWNCTNSWMQFYAGEAGFTYDYGDITIRRNLFYNAGGDTMLSLQSSDTTRSGPVVIENNTFVAEELDTWDAQSYTQLRERFYQPNINPGTFTGQVTGDSCKNNLVIARGLFPFWANNNVIWVQVSGSNGTDNVFVEAEHNNDPLWVDDQLVAGTFAYDITIPSSDPADGAYTWQPKAGSFLATGGEGGTYIGATPPAA